MAQKNRKPYFRILVTTIVAIIIPATVGISLLAAVENLRFIHLTSQIFNIIQFARDAAIHQKNFAVNAGDDVWENFVHLGLTSSSSAPLNAWNEPVNATVIATNSIRIETYMPVHDCRRFAAYFLSHPSILPGIVRLETQVADAPNWTQVYPVLSPHSSNPNASEQGCGKNGIAHLGLVIQIRE